MRCAIDLHAARPVAVTVVCALLWSCSGERSSVSFSEAELLDSVALGEELGAPVCKAGLRLVTVEGAASAEAINGYVLRELLGAQADVPVAEAMRGYVDAQLREFTDIVRDMYYADLAYRQSDSAEVEPPLQLAARYSYDYATEASAALGRADSVVCYRWRAYRYMGGAHGMSSERWLTFSLKSGAVLTWQQLFGEDFEEALCRLLSEKLMMQEGVATMEALHERGYLYGGEMFVSDDMLMESERIVFHYDPYEIAPYVLGDIDIAFTYGELSPYFLP